MKSDEAIDNFFGRNGKKRLNCAQSVAAVFINNGFFSEEDFFDLKNCGFGKAPQGYCGSVYAAHCILGKVSKAKAEKFNNEFIAYAKFLTCKEIRMMEKIKCFQTVKKATELIEKILML